MNSRKVVDEFLKSKTIAVVGVSRDSKKFANAAFRELKEKGFKVVPVNPHAGQLEGERCFANLASIDEPVDAALLMTPSAQTLSVVKDAATAGIKRVWIQQGAETREAIEFCQQNNIDFVQKECVLMFAEPLKFFHKPHRWIWKMLGKLPS